MVITHQSLISSSFFFLLFSGIFFALVKFPIGLHGWGLTNIFIFDLASCLMRLKTNRNAIEDSFMAMLKMIVKSDMFVYTGETSNW